MPGTDGDELMKEEVRVEVAGRCICLKVHPVRKRSSKEADSSLLIDQIQNDYKVFLSTREPAITIEINLTDKKYVNESSWAGLTISGSEIELTDDYLQSKIDLAKGYGVASISLGGLKIGLGTLLRNLFTLTCLLLDEAIALHAASILKEGRVYIFVGSSGSGKTTVAKLSKGYTVLSDDLAIIKPTDGSYFVFPTPHWLDMQTGDRENRPYPIGGLFKLVKDDKIYLKEIPPAKAIAEVFTLPHIPAQFQPTQRLLDSFCDMLDKYSFYELHFLKDKSFWRCIDGFDR